MKEKADITPRQEAELFVHAEAIKEILGPHAKELAKLSVKTPGAELAQLFRPYLVSTLSAADGRESQWGVKVYIWAFETDPSVDGSLWADNGDGDRVSGLNGVRDLVREYLEAHDISPSDIDGLDKVEHPFTQLELRRRMTSIRPAITRGGGKCSTRWQYEVGGEKFMLQIDIARVRQENS